MRNNRSKIAVIAIGAVMLAVLLVCLLQPEQSKDSASAEERSYTVISDSDTDEVGTMYMYQQYSENVIIDTDIPASAPESAHLIYAKPMQFDEQILISVFLNGKGPVQREETSDGSYVYLGLEDGTYIGIERCWGINYRSESGYMHLKLATENFLTDGEYAYMRSLNEKFSEIYQRKELDFMSPEAAIAEVRKILEPLPITLSENVEIYAIDHETAQMYQDSYLQKHQNAAGSYTIKDVLTEEDDCYLICFRILQDDIPITRCSYINSGSHREVEGSVVEVFYSSKGIIKLTATGIYQTESVGGQVNDFISAQQAIEEAVRTVTGRVTVISCSFEYVGVPYSNTYGEVLLTPAWSVAVKDSAGFCETVFISAVTGEKIK